MKNATRVLLLTAAAIVVATLPVFAQVTDTATLNVSAVVSARAELTLSTAAISFPDSDPDLVPNINAVGGPLDVTTKVKASRNATVTLTAIANGDFSTGGATPSTIPAGALQWTGAGVGFAATGTMSSTVAQPVGSWTNSGSRAGVQSYTMVNSWAYAVGNYSMIVTYTLTAP